MEDFKIIKPRRLERGDTIGVVAPASSFDVDNFKLGIKKLRSIGYKVKYEKCIFSRYWSSSGHDKKRAEQINRMFLDKQVKAVFCAKAGYGSIEILPFLDEEIIRENPKIFIGYSDITILLFYLQRVANMVVFHGPVISGEIHEGMNPLTLNYLLQAIAMPSGLGVLKFDNFKSFKPGRGSGRLTGGNISLIVKSLGTAYEIDTTGKILFLEDVGEDLADIRDYLIHLKQAGKFKKVKGIIFGKMANCFDDSESKGEVRDTINQIFSEVNAPIIFGFPSGHAAKKSEARITLPFGVNVSVDANKLKVVFKEGGVG